jgi:Zn-dependent protease with chaperone function
MADELSSSSRRSLNPFAFPSETNIRFALLMIAALTLAFWAGGQLPEIINHVAPGTIRDRLSDYLTQLSQTNDISQAETFLLGPLGAFGFFLESYAFQIGTTLLVTVVAFALYMRHPSRIRKQKGLTPLSADTDIPVSREVQALSHLANVSPSPGIEVSKNLRAQDGIAFGTFQHYIVGLEGGLRVALRKTPGAFRAVVLHELAHIANRDVGRTHFAQALWHSTIWLVFAPLAVTYIALLVIDDLIIPLVNNSFSSVVWDREITVRLPSLFFFYLQLGALYVVFATIRASLLRARELYADRRAADCLGDTQLLSNILNSSPTHAGKWKRVKLLRLHPSPQERRECLQDPNALLTFRADLPFFVGLLVTIVGSLIIIAMLVVLNFGVVTNAAAHSMFNTNDIRLMETSVLLLQIGMLAVPLALSAVVLVVAYSLTGTLGVQVWQGVFIDMVAGKSGPAKYFRLLIPSTLVMLGVLVGMVIMPMSFALPSRWSNLAWIVALLCLTTLATWLCLVYARFWGQRVFTTHFSRYIPTWKRRFLTGALTVIFTAFYVPLVYGIQPYVYVAGADLLRATQEAVINGLLIGLVLYALVFGITFVIVSVGHLADRPQCPNCGRSVEHRASLTCESCGESLVPWVFANTAAQSSDPPRSRKMSWLALLLTVSALIVIGLLVVLASSQWGSIQASAVEARQGTTRATRWTSFDDDNLHLAYPDTWYTIGNGQRCQECLLTLAHATTETILDLQHWHTSKSTSVDEVDEMVWSSFNDPRPSLESRASLYIGGWTAVKRVFKYPNLKTGEMRHWETIVLLNNGECYLLGFLMPNDEAVEKTSDEVDAILQSIRFNR